MTAPGSEVAVARLDSNLLIPDASLAPGVARVAQVTQMIDDKLLNYQPPTGVDQTQVQSIVDQRLTAALSSTPFEIRYSGPSWQNRPATDRPIHWIGGPSSPPLGGSTSGGVGMAPIDTWDS